MSLTAEKVSVIHSFMYLVFQRSTEVDIELVRYKQYIIQKESSQSNTYDNNTEISQIKFMQECYVLGMYSSSVQYIVYLDRKHSNKP